MKRNPITALRGIDSLRKSSAKYALRSSNTSKTAIFF